MSIEDDIKAELVAEGVNIDDTSKQAISSETIKHNDGELSDFEKEQMTKGWRPDGEKSAEEWARAQPLYETISKRNKQLHEMQRAIDSLTSHMKKQEEIAYKKALETVRKEKQLAIERGDVNAVMAAEKKQEALTQPQPESIPEAQDFIDKYSNIFNSSGYDEMEIANFVKQRDIELASRKMGPSEHMKTLEEHMLKKFPNYFGYKKEVVSRNPDNVEADSYSGVSRGTTKKSKLSFADLTSEQKQVARDFEKYGIMKIDEYLKQIISLQDTGVK